MSETTGHDATTDPSWGGSRPGNPNGKRGGARKGSGPITRNLHLSHAAALKLRKLTRMRNFASVTEMVEYLIEVAE